MSSGYFNKGYQDAQNGNSPELPTDHKRYDIGNAILDFVFCPGLGLALAAGESKGTKSDDEEYKQGFLAGSLAKK